MKQIALSGILFLAWYASAHAQYAICGKVMMNDENRSNALVTILETKDAVRTNTSGNFCFGGLPAGEYSLQADYNGLLSPVIKLLVKDDVSNANLAIPAGTLDTVTIAALSRATLRQIHSIQTGVIELSREARSSVSVEQLLNRATGIRVRNSGGLGAEADIVVGGFNGKSIKFLIDGIPVDYLGSSMGITKINTNMADYIEVYKGVMPTEVGIDALGGAINIVSKKPAKTSHHFSYETGSFNTHRLSLNSFIRRSQKFSFGVNAFVNYTTNNFKVDKLPLVDEATGRTRFVTAPLFHNAYRQYTGEAYMNFEKLKWADLFKIKVNSYAIKRDIQNDFATRSRPFGGVFRKEHAYIVPSVEYQKKFWDNKLKLSQFIVYSSIDNQLADTVKNARYDWLGNRHEAVSGSEMGMDMSNLEKPVIETRLHNLTYRGLFSYKITTTQQLILNVVNNYFTRKSDNLNEYRTKTHIHYNRFIAGLGYQYRLPGNRLEGLSQVKYLGSQTKGTLSNYITGEKEAPVQNSGWSFAQSLKYRFYDGWLIRASVENTYRLPDQGEIFGDNTFILPNLTLRPERSFNVNAGAQYKRNDLYSIELNTYLRNVKDLIRLKEVTQFQSVFLNLDKVRGYGIELEGMVQPVKRLELSGNLTYNEFRFKGSNAGVSNNDHFINARVSNMPFYFGNAMVSYRLDRLFNEKDRIRFYAAYTYVHQYYLDFIEKQYEPDGFLGLFGKSKIYTNRIIPVQQIYSAGFVWTLKWQNEKAFSLSTELNNIFDTPVFNTFKMQSAGRNISAKITIEF
ncbi:MAG: TonB-dependent receptor [Chitinophagaceae bacterium]|nr:TonB-dependent receptor [Chitinophagaceae bacterium]